MEGDSVDQACADLRKGASNGSFHCVCHALQKLTRARPQHCLIDATDENGETALTLAVTHGQVKVVELLLDKGADHQHTPDDSTPIPLVRCGHTCHACCAMTSMRRSVCEPYRRQAS